jgi:hypothetical protein
MKRSRGAGPLDSDPANPAPRRRVGLVFARPCGEECVMPQVTIRLRCDPATGKKDIIISMRSDADALPHEHEQQHRAIVEKVLQGGLVKASELGQVIVEREEEQGEAAPAAATPEAERRAQSQGG